MLQTLHELGIVFRDLKPENIIVMRSSARLKLVDFGFAKQINKTRTRTTCGSPAYTAPEILLCSHEDEYSKTGYSYECDIWSLGVLICELVGGFNPFQGSNVNETFNNIITVNVNWPRNISKSCRHLLQHIFVREPTQRLNLNQIKEHGFFKGVDWSQLDDSFATERAGVLGRVK
jgi:serine/threonine protein kinase